MLNWTERLNFDCAYFQSVLMFPMDTVFGLAIISHYIRMFKSIYIKVACFLKHTEDSMLIIYKINEINQKI